MSASGERTNVIGEGTTVNKKTPKDWLCVDAHMRPKKAPISQTVAAEEELNASILAPAIISQK
ncbi:MAG: hypothetical protein QXQ46_04445 [Thermoplasmatales archaeon]